VSLVLFLTNDAAGGHCADVVSLTVYVECERESAMDLSGKCPGDTRLVDYVRRKMQRTCGLQLTQLHNRRMVLQMTRASGSDCLWTSPAKHFKVQ